MNNDNATRLLPLLLREDLKELNRYIRKIHKDETDGHKQAKEILDLASDLMHNVDNLDEVSESTTKIVEKLHSLARYNVSDFLDRIDYINLLTRYMRSVDPPKKSKNPHPTSRMHGGQGVNQRIRPR